MGLPISPRFTPSDFFTAMQFQHSSNSSTNRLNFTFSRSHAFRYERKNTNTTLVRIELTTSALDSRCAVYPLDHSGDEGYWVGGWMHGCRHIGINWASTGCMVYGCHSCSCGRLNGENEVFPAHASDCQFFHTQAKSTDRFKKRNQSPPDQS